MHFKKSVLKNHLLYSIITLMAIAMLFPIMAFAVLCTLNKMGISSYITLMSSCVLDIGYAVLFFRDSIIRRIFWGFSYSHFIQRA